MTVNKATSADDFKLASSYHAVRKVLLQDRYADRLEKPLAYWTLPKDRRLPLAFLDRTLRQLLETPFEQLAATQGIGQKKISTLVKLLHRVTRDEEPSTPFGLADLANEVGPTATARLAGSDSDFDPAAVSEVLWEKWREVVRRHGLGHEKLGRLAPSLDGVPTVIWNATLSQYVDCSLTEVRRLRTHGEKRVRCVLEVFHAIYHKLAGAGVGSYLALRLMPAHVARVESWLDQVQWRQVVPHPERVTQGLAQPLLDQMQVDAGTQVYQLACQRLGIDEAPRPVRTQARQLGVTRARIYQLLDDCTKVMHVRWPEGRARLRELACMCEALGAAPADIRMLQAVRDLFFPEKQLLATERKPSQPQDERPREGVLAGH